MQPELASSMSLRQPYPGLRPFEPDEAMKFHGRETATADLLRRLSENRFIAVVGNSGSGKSSLVRAGLLPALYRGRLIGTTSQWRICIMRPGDAPMESLAESLAERRVFSDDKGAVLREVCRSSLGLVRAVRASQFTPGESLLLVVDQFEELFRFVKEGKTQDGGSEGRLLVASLLEAADLSSVPVYVVLTMRSDFTGDCSQFSGLPEALNRSQYLIPRMTRAQVRGAIEKPPRLVGAQMSARLVEQLLNELGDEEGQLPVLQHALNRMFHKFEQRGMRGEITVKDYAAAGELHGALNAHAEALIDSLRQPPDRDGPASLSSLDPSISPWEGERWVERVFRCLTAVEGGRIVRRPTRLDRIFEIVGSTNENTQSLVRKVIGTYSDADSAMLFWSGKELTCESVIDISHESLIEHWERLKGWVVAEGEAAILYQNATEDAVRRRRGAAAQWRGRKLAEALALFENGPWNEAWAARLSNSGAPFAEVKAFVEGEAATQRAEEEEKEAGRVRELEAERRAKEAAEARAMAESQAREAAEKATQAELRAREAAEAAVEAERTARMEAEAHAEAEKRAKAAAETLTKIERQKKSWILLAAILGLGALGLGLWVLGSEYERLYGQNQLSAATDLIPALHSQIAASDHSLAQYAQQEQDLSNQISHATDSGEKRKLQAHLAVLLDEKRRVEKQRDGAEARLSRETKRRTRINAVDGLAYVYIPAGAFTMGCSPGDDHCEQNEKPPRAVQIANGFWLGQTEVTQAAWRKVMNNSPSHFKGDELPVESIDWTQASYYCKAIGGRLPTEQEWEYAARADVTVSRYGPLDAIAWYESNSHGTTQQVGLKQPNAFGLNDMLGNVWEWTASSYDATGPQKVVRGGAWDNSSGFVRSSIRSWNDPSSRINFLGFRCVGEFHPGIKPLGSEKW